MRYPLAGLAAHLSEEQCQTVALRRISDHGTVVFGRYGEDAWAAENQESDALHTPELLARIQAGFGEQWDRIDCLGAGEQLTYVIEKGALRIRRGAAEPAVHSAEAEAAGMRALAEALGIPRSRRKHKLEQALRFCGIVEGSLAGREKGELGVLDLACGRSYLGFVLAHRLAAGGNTVRLHGVDSNPAFVEKCRKIARDLAWTNATFEAADLSNWTGTPARHDIVVSLHGCDTLTDEAIRIGWESRAPLLFVAPCCQHELRHLWKDHPLRWIKRYGLLEQRLADVLTDAFRCLVLEALGYRVKVLRFAAPDITPKNLLIQAQHVGGARPERMKAARAFCRQFGVRPRLAAWLETVGA